MNPIYKFTLAINGGAEQQVFPVYRDDLAKDFELQTNQEFYRAKLSGKLTFVRDDYDLIANQSFDAQFGIKIYISYDAGSTWTLYWTGQFWKTNCTFNADDKNVTLTPDVVDKYTDILAGMEKEYNLIDLVPQIVPVTLDKRSMIQVYVPGTTVIACFLSGMWWEQECEKVEENETVQVEIEGETVTVNKLTWYLDFAKNRGRRFINVTGTTSPTLPDEFGGAVPDPPTETYVYDEYTYDSGGYRFHYKDYGVGGGGGGTRLHQWTISRISDDTVLWQRNLANQYFVLGLPYEIILYPVEGSGATGNVSLYVHDISVFARRVCDVETIQGVQTYELPKDDLVENNRNYTRAIGYYAPDTILFSSYLSTTPTKWGIYQPGLYYDTPSTLFVPEWFPIARAVWGRISIWFAFAAFDWYAEERSRKEYTLRHAYPIWSVISVLLGQIAPNITHQESTDYSKFLYGINPLLGIDQRLFITPKSNLISSGYDQPAQQAPITLKRVMDMLRDCFRCYWFVDDQNRFRIEHIYYFMNGGTYSPGQPNIGRDLTAEQVTRNGKKWAFGTSEYKFDKPEMAARYQFGWMDDVTALFDGNPIDIVSKYVNPDNIEQIDISQFTSDVDYILLNPGEISKDGFVLMSAVARRYSKTVTSETGVYYSNQIDGNFLAGEKILVSYTPSGVFEDNFAILGDQTGEIERIYYGQQTLITLPRNTTFLNIFRGAAKVLQDADVTFTFVRLSEYKLPYLWFGQDMGQYVLQNGYAAFVYLQQYYFWDMPARYFKYNGEQMVAQGIKKLKTQTLKFPAFNDPNTLQLIKTNLGNGTIQKMSVNLSSRNANATLKYDTE